MVRWSQSALAERAGVSVETIKRLEGLEGPLRATKSATLEAIEKVLKAAGVEFLSENGGGDGVRMRLRPK